MRITEPLNISWSVSNLLGCISKESHTPSSKPGLWTHWTSRTSPTKSASVTSIAWKRVEATGVSSAIEAYNDFITWFTNPEFMKPNFFPVLICPKWFSFKNQKTLSGFVNSGFVKTCDELVILRPQLPKIHRWPPLFFKLLKLPMLI